jgi:hypothetical protein
MITAHLFREHRKTCVVGGIQFSTGYQCYTLELPWRDNEPELSCIPEGVYSCGLRPSAKFGNSTGGMAYHIQPVPGRTDILIHAGNSTRDTHGCILVGEGLVVDESPRLVQSRKAIIAMHAHLGGQPFTLSISS